MSVGLHIEGFDLIEKLGEGGGAPVWKARQRSLDRIVAIKVLTTPAQRDPADIERLQAEAQSAAKLKHPGIVQVYDARAEADFYYFVMEYVAGYTVGDWIRRKGAVDEKEALLVAESVAMALEYAWNKERIVHCDIKPDNVFVDSDGTVKVGDLGLARIGAIGGDSRQDEVMGTPSYISPEQASGEANLDFRADIYSLGAMLYHMVSGRPLFAGHDEQHIMDLQVHGQDDDLLDVNPKASAALSWLIERMLAKDRDDRPAGWAELIGDLAEVRRGDLPAHKLPRGKVSTMRRTVRRTVTAPAVMTSKKMKRVPAAKAAEGPNLLAIGIAVGAMGLVLIGGLIAAWISRRSEPPRTPAPPTVIVPQPPPPLPPEPDTSAEDAARATFEQARRWVLDHPDEFDEAMRRLMVVAGETAGTSYARRAEDEIRRVKWARMARVGEVLRQIEQQAAEVAATGTLLQAAVFVESYGGSFAADTREQRARRGQEYRERESRRTGEAIIASNAEQGRLERVLDEVVALLKGGETEGAARLAREATEKGDFRSKRGELTHLADMLDRAVRLPDRILGSFRENVGQRVTVQLLSGPKTVTIERVEGDAVQAREDTVRGGASVRMAVSFGVMDLAVRERLLRMGPDDQPEVAVTKGLMALKSSAYAHARKYFALVGPPLGPRLLAAVDVAEKGPADSAEEARKDLGMVLRSLGVEIGAYNAQEWQRAVEAWKTNAPPAARAASPAAVADYRKKYAGGAFMQEAEPILLAVEQALAAEPAEGARRDDGPRKGRGGRAGRRPHRRREGSPLTVVAAGHALRDELARNLLRVNPTLADDDVKLEVDAEGKPYRLDIASPGVANLGPVAALKDLRALYCGAVPPSVGHVASPRSPLRDLSPLRGLPIEALDLALTAVTDLSPLRGMPLAEINLRHTSVSDLTPLRGLPLTRVNLSGANVRGLAPLRDCDLAELNLHGASLSDFGPLEGMELESLDVGATAFRDSSVLRGMPLRRLDLSGSRVYDFTPLRGMPLEWLDLTETQFRDASVLKDAPLKTLQLARTKVTDLEPLRGLQLTSLNLSHTLVSDFSPLDGMPLVHLNLTVCRIADLSALRNMPLQGLTLQDTRVRSLEPLAAIKTLRSLNIGGTDVPSLAPLRDLQLESFECRGARILDFTPLARQPIGDIGLDNADSPPVQQVLRSMPKLRVVNGAAWQRW